MRIAVTLVGLVAWLVVSPAHGADPHRSWSILPFTNGHGASSWEVATPRARTLREHVYGRESAETLTRDVLADTRLAVRIGPGPGQWLSDVPPDDTRYLDGAGIVVTTQTVGVLTIETYAFAPWALSAPGLVVLARVLGSDRVPAEGVDVTAYSLHDLHLGEGRPEPGTSGEEITWRPETASFAETGPAGAAVAVPLPLPTRHACSPGDPALDIADGRDLVDVDASGVKDDAVSAFQWDLGHLRVGDSAWFGYVLAFDAGGDAAALRGLVAQAIGKRDARGLLTAERASWEAFLGPVPVDFNDEALTGRLALTVLRMAQVREPGDAHGQIVASVSPGADDVARVRDMAYAIVGLAHAERPAEARDALDFILDAHAGAYEEEVGEPYGLSVAGYYGDGTEQTADGAAGPNIELDGWGLFLWAARHHVDVARDQAWLDLRWDDVNDSVASVLARRVDDTGLVQEDSSLWQGPRQHHAYTSLAAARGLCDAASLAGRMGDDAVADRYREAARALGASIATTLVARDGVLGGSLEDVQAGEGFLDTAVFEAFGWRVLTPRSGLARSTILGLQDLELPDGVGYLRNDDGGEGGEDEWIVADLRASVALEAHGMVPGAEMLVDWITELAGENFGLLPQRYEGDTGDYAGAVPLTGAGAAYRLAVDTVEEDDSCFDVLVGPEPDGGTGDAGADGGTQDEPAGCACRTASTAPGTGRLFAWGGLVFVALLARAAQRRSQR